jgi:hypothetical protein
MQGYGTLPVETRKPVITKKIEPVKYFCFMIKVVITMKLLFIKALCEECELHILSLQVLHQDSHRFGLAVFDQRTNLVFDWSSGNGGTGKPSDSTVINAFNQQKRSQSIDDFHFADIVTLSLVQESWKSKRDEVRRGRWTRRIISREKEG